MDPLLPTSDQRGWRWRSGSSKCRLTCEAAWLSGRSGRLKRQDARWDRQAELEKQLQAAAACANL